jgi:hypothetical protein
MPQILYHNIKVHKTQHEWWVHDLLQTELHQQSLIDLHEETLNHQDKLLKTQIRIQFQMFRKE